MGRIIVTPQSKATVLLPLPPSTNNLFATVNGRRVKTREYKTWLNTAAAALIELRHPASLPAEIHATVFGAVNAQRDLDNLLKPVGDSLVAAGVLPGDSVKYVTKWVVGYAGRRGETSAWVEVRVVHAEGV